MPLEPGDTRQMAALEQCRNAGLHVISINVASGDQSSADALAMLGTFRSWIAENSDTSMAVSTAADALSTKALGKLGICFDIEGMSVLDGQLDLIQTYYDLGVRWMLSAYNHANVAGSGCLDAMDGGLTPFGRSVVGEMNRVGMVVCGSHAGYRTARELIDASSAPVIFSHSNPRGMWHSPRNIPDDLMQACAARGGVVGINGIGHFLGANDNRISTLVAHIAYAIDLIGEDHVGLALDYCFGEEDGLVDFMADYPALFPQGPQTAQGMTMIAPWRLGEIIEALDACGIRHAMLRKLLGGNHLRIAQTVWR